MKIDIHIFCAFTFFFSLIKFSMNILFCSVIDTQDKLFCFDKLSTNEKKKQKYIIKLLLDRKFYRKCSI